MRIRTLSFIVLLGLVTSVATAQPIWSTKFANLGLAGKVYALLPAHDSLYVGGRFTTVAGVPASNIALWDGKAWHALGAGTDKGVYSLAFDVDGTVIAGGEFSTAGGSPASCIARWDGNIWSPIGSGIIPPPSSKKTARRGVLSILRTSANEIFIGGCFDRNGEGTRLNDVARWNGKLWDTLGYGFASYGAPSDGTREPGVLSLVETKWGVAAAGYFVAANYLLGSGISFWSGNVWSSPLIDTPAQVNVTSMFYAGGSLVFAGDVASKWPSLPFVGYSGNGIFAGPPESPGFPVSFVAGIGATTYAAQGAPCDTCHVQNLAAFAGVWSPIGGGIDSTVNLMFSSGSRLYLAGNFTHANGQASDGIAMYDADPAAVQDMTHLSLSQPTSLFTRTGRIILTGLGQTPSAFNDLAVFDALGRAMDANDIFTGDSNGDGVEVNISALPNGLYLITDGAKAIKVLLQR